MLGLLAKGIGAIASGGRAIARGGRITASAFKAGRQALNAGADISSVISPSAIGQAITNAGGGIPIGYAVTSAIRGGLIGAGAGAGMWGLTGNSDWMLSLATAGVLRGGAGGFAKGSTSIGKTANLGWFAPGRLSRNMAIGGAVGFATDNPGFAPLGAVALPAARFVQKMMYSPKGMGNFMKGVAQLPFNPSAGARTLSKLSTIEMFAAPSLIGVMGGGGYAAFKGLTGFGSQGRNSATSGYYPGGVAPLHPGRGKGIPNDNLSTEGLTLALHKNARRTRHMQ